MAKPSFLNSPIRHQVLKGLAITSRTINKIRASMTRVHATSSIARFPATGIGLIQKLLNFLQTWTPTLKSRGTHAWISAHSNNTTTYRIPTAGITIWPVGPVPRKKKKTQQTWFNLPFCPPKKATKKANSHGLWGAAEEAETERFFLFSNNVRRYSHNN